MNAILREQYEAPVLTNEAIEVHLSYLRPAVEKLTERVDALDEKFSGKIDALHGRIDALAEKFDGELDALAGRFDGKLDALNGKVDALAEQINEKIDQANKDRAAGDAALGAKIDKLSDLTLGNQGTLKAMGWLISVVSVVAAAISIARTLEWL